MGFFRGFVCLFVLISENSNLIFILQITGIVLESAQGNRSGYNGIKYKIVFARSYFSQASLVDVNQCELHVPKNLESSR